MLNRIFVGLAIVASIFVAAFGFFSVKPKIETMVKQRAEEKDAKVKAQTDLASTKKTLTNTENRLKTTQNELATTKSDRDKARAEAKQQQERADKRDAEYKDVLGQRDEARAKLFLWDQLGVTPDQIKGMIQKIVDLGKEREVMTEENKKLLVKIQKLDDRIRGLIGDDSYVVELPAELRGTVVAVDPKLEFCVLDFGENKGAREKGELLVHRNGQLIAKLRISSVEPNRCIANVIPGNRFHELLEGDVVFPANN